MNVRKTIRFLIDVVAIFVAYLAGHALGGSLWAGVGAAILLAAYGLWCFTDGAMQ